MKPPLIKRERLASSLRITYAWRSPTAYFLLVFALGWNGFIGVFLLAGAGWPLALHALVGLFLIWYVLALLLNRTVLEATGRELRVQHGPIRTWTRDRLIPVADLRQLYVSQSGSEKTGRTKHTLWALKAELTNGETFALLSSTRDKAAIQGIERELEDYLGILHEDRSESLEMPDLTRLKELLPAGLHRHLDPEAHQGGRAAGVGEPRQRTLSTPGPFLFYCLPANATFCVQARPHRLVSNHEIGWNGPHRPSAHILTASGVKAYRRFYAELIRDRWAYFEERPLDAGERTALGFLELTAHPSSLRNGDDRYYPDELQQGTYKSGSQAGTALDQYTYLSTRSTTRFRALRAAGGPWEVSVQEPVDDDLFSRCTGEEG